MTRTIAEIRRGPAPPPGPERDRLHAWATRVATLEAHGGGHLLFTEAADICATWRSSLAWRLAAALRRRAA